MQKPVAYGLRWGSPTASRATLVMATCSVLLASCGSFSEAPGSGADHQGSVLPPAASSGHDPAASAPMGSTGSQLNGQILSAWLAAEQAFDTAALTADPSEPDMAATTVPPQLTWARSFLGELRAEDEIAQGTVDYGVPRVVSLGEQQARVRSCVHDAEIVVSASSGQPVPGDLGQVDFELITSTMALADSGWKLSSQQVVDGRCD